MFSSGDFDNKVAFMGIKLLNSGGNRGIELVSDSKLAVVI